MVSATVHKAGDPGDEDDKALSWMVLEFVARQRNEYERGRVREVIAGLPAQCVAVIDEYHMGYKALRRRRGWAANEQSVTKYTHSATPHHTGTAPFSFA